MTSPKRFTNVFFKFKDGTSNKDVKAGLAEVGSIKGVFNTEALFKGEKDPELKLMHIARVNLVQSEDARESIAKVKNVEYANFGAKRKLMRG